MRNSTTQNTKVVLTQNGTVKIRDEALSTPSTSYASAVSASRQSSLYNALEEDDFEGRIMDEFDAHGKIYVDDELHLVGEGTRSSPFLNAKTVFMLVLNFLFISLSITWLMAHKFQVDLMGTIFISLAAWTLIFNIITAFKILRQVRERTLLMGKPNDFRDYVTKLQSSQQNPILHKNDRFSSNNNTPIFV